MSNLALLTPALSDAGVISDPGPTGVGVANLLTMQPGEAFVASTVNCAFDLDLGSAKVIDGVMALHFGTTTSLTWRIRGATSQANLTASPGFDSGVVSAYATGSRPTGYAAADSLTAYRLLSPSQNFQWWRINFADAVSLYSIGRIYFAKMWQPAVNIQFNWQLGWLDVGIRNRALGGQTFTKDLGRLRYMEFEAAFESESELYTNSHEIDRLRGETKDVFVVRDPAATTFLHSQSIYGLMTGLKPIVNPFFQNYAKSYRIEELTT